MKLNHAARLVPPPPLRKLRRPGSCALILQLIETVRYIQAILPDAKNGRDYRSKKSSIPHPRHLPAPAQENGDDDDEDEDNEDDSDK